MTDWENRYRSGDTPWIKGRAAPALAQVPPHVWGAGPVLVPGCGLGDDVRAIAAHGIPVLGLDLAPTAISRAENFPKIGSESYELGDFFDPIHRAGRSFSAIWEHTCFCAIDPAQRLSYAESAAACLAEGGLLVGVFYLNPYHPGEEQDGPPFGVTVEDLDALFAPWFERVSGEIPRDAYPGREGREWLGQFRKLPNR